MCNAIIASVVLLSLLVKYGNCIECYSCLSSENPDCLDPEKYHLDKVKCNTEKLMETQKFAGRVDPIFSKIFEAQIPENYIPLNCLKQVTQDRGKEEVILRGCQLPRADRLDVCKKVNEVEKKEFLEVKHCSLCDTEGCNSASSLQIITKIIMFAIVAIVAFR